MYISLSTYLRSILKTRATDDDKMLVLKDFITVKQSCHVETTEILKMMLFIDYANRDIIILFFCLKYGT